MAIQNGGPRTTRGKLRASRNARKHGLFSREFLLTPEERLEFDQLRTDLWEELQPDIASLRLIFDDVVACAWRVKLALRCELRAVRKHLADDNPQPMMEKSAAEYPSPSPTSELKRRLKLLENLRTHFAQARYVPEEVGNAVRKEFGVEFLNALTEWDATNYQTMALTSYIVAKAEAFKMDLPEIPKPLKEFDYRKVDSFLRHQMMLKLMDNEKRHLLLALDRVQQTKAGESTMLESTDRLDLYVRCGTTARREFYRAFAEYREAKARSRR